MELIATQLLCTLVLFYGERKFFNCRKIRQKKKLDAMGFLRYIDGKRTQLSEIRYSLKR